MKVTRGRLVEAPKSSPKDGSALVLSVYSHPHLYYIEASRESFESSRAKPGDIIEVTENQSLSTTDVRVLTSQHPSRENPGKEPRTYWLKQILQTRRIHGATTRAQIERLIRDFFLQRAFIETRTPLLVPCPGMEPHIRPLEVTQPSNGRVHRAYLPTSPEFAMKRLMVAGLDRIFQICPAFRDEPTSTTHEPEFTMLEWYRNYAGYEDIMRDTEALFEFIALKLFGKPELTFQGQTISVKTPWPRLKIRDLFQEMVGVDLVRCNTKESLLKEARRLGVMPNEKAGEEDTWDDLYFRIWLTLIEPRLPQDRAVFVTRYPASQAALSVVDQDPDGSRWAKRFEAYAGGIELGNAFEELTDPQEQRKRFTEDMELREKLYGKAFPKNPLDESFLGALEEGLPPAGGIAMGVDRIVMLFANEPEIKNTFWITPAELV